MTPLAETCQRRSPVHDLIEPLKPVRKQIRGMSTALYFKDPESEDQKKRELALCDVSCFPRMSVKGPGTVSWLEQMQVPVPETVYSCLLLEDDGLVIRTDRQEVFLEDGPQSHIVSRLTEQLASGVSSLLRVERQDAAFLLSGSKANQVLAETCGFDFREPGIQLVMTRVAGVSCALLPLRTAGVPVYRIWLDGSYGVYLWEALLEIIHEHGGDAVGLACFYPVLMN